MKSINVVAALIEKNKKVLCVQRGYSKYDYLNEKWEFPGGKIEDGEVEEKALKREIKEELSMEIEIIDKLITVEHAYPDFNIIMHIFNCSSNDEPVLNEHINLKWLTKEELHNLNWAAADIPAVKKYMETC
jgi:8-oxo-dGTP diphosphatase